VSGNFSGAGKNIFRLLRRIDPEKLEPILVGQTEYEVTKRVREHGIKVFIIPFPPALDIHGKKILSLNIIECFQLIGAVWNYNLSLIRFFKQIKPQIIWSDNIRTFYTVFPASKLSRCKVIMNTFSEPKGKAAFLLHRLSLFLADVINLEYRGQRQKLFGVLANINLFRKKIIPLYTGVTDFEQSSGSNIHDELSLSSTDILIIMASNITPLKGQLDLLKAMNKLLNNFPNIHLLIAGRAVETDPVALDYDSRLKQYTKKEKLTHNVHFLGWRTDIPDLLQAADIYVSTSYSDSLPEAPRDAMSYGKPVVATNIGGTSDLVTMNISGFLFEPGDVDSLVKFLSRLIHDPRLRASMGAEGKRIIDERFSTKVYVRNFEDMVLGLYH